MTKNITIANPSPKLLQFFDALRDKKQQQIEKLSGQKECIFTVKV